MRQRLVRIESRNAGVVVTVSDRALSVRFPMLMSFAQDGINPQRMVVKWRIFLPCSNHALGIDSILGKGHEHRKSDAIPNAWLKWRIFLPCSLRTIRTGCVGAML